MTSPVSVGFDDITNSTIGDDVTTGCDVMISSVVAELFGKGSISELVL